MEIKKEIVAYKLKDLANLEKAQQILKDYLIEYEVWEEGRNMSIEGKTFAKNSAFYDVFVRNRLLDTWYGPIFSYSPIKNKEEYIQYVDLYNKIAPECKGVEFSEADAINSRICKWKDEIDLRTNLVPFELIYELNNVGYNGNEIESFASYDSEGVLIFPAKRLDKNFTQAPLYQQAFKWFRDKHNLCSEIRGASFRASYVIAIPNEIIENSFDGGPLVLSWNYVVDDKGGRKTYEEAQLACLKKLIILLWNSQKAISGR